MCVYPLAHPMGDMNDAVGDAAVVSPENGITRGRDRRPFAELPELLNSQTTVSWQKKHFTFYLAFYTSIPSTILSLHRRDRSFCFLYRIVF